MQDHNNVPFDEMESYDSFIGRIDKVRCYIYILILFPVLPGLFFILEKTTKKVDNNMIKEEQHTSSDMKKVVLWD